MYSMSEVLPPSMLPLSTRDAILRNRKCGRERNWITDFPIKVSVVILLFQMPITASFFEFWASADTSDLVCLVLLEVVVGAINGAGGIGSN